jgi:hypothetical protein
VLLEPRKVVLAALPDLRGRNLASWCPLPQRGEPDNCYAASLLELANRQRGIKNGTMRCDELWARSGR